MPNGPLDQFLQPQSMVTPGFLGGLAMVGTNTIAVLFQVPYASPALPIIATGFAFFFGLAAIVKSSSIMQKLVFYVINSIVILSVATGSNVLGQQTQQYGYLSPASADPIVFYERDSDSPLERVQFFRQWFPNSPNTSTSGTSTVCLFVTGPRAGQRQKLAAPQKIGEPCSDGQGNSGSIIGR